MSGGGYTPQLTPQLLHKEIAHAQPARPSVAPASSTRPGCMPAGVGGAGAIFVKSRAVGRLPGAAGAMRVSGRTVVGVADIGAPCWGDAVGGTIPVQGCAVYAEGAGACGA